ncbi:MAG: KOW domain-containing RNA-binding protein [Oscillospiraceae bacterium]|nr:KOW domain-containing RNA-binding protein [Oscillospiraceae bacterium]
MMQLQVGMIVRAIAGKEQGKFYSIIKLDNHFVYLADGKHRKLEQPKRKNKKHVRATGTVWDLNGMTNSALRYKLRQYQDSNSPKEENEFVERRFD